MNFLSGRAASLGWAEERGGKKRESVWSSGAIDSSAKPFNVVVVVVVDLLYNAPLVKWSTGLKPHMHPGRANWWPCPSEPPFDRRVYISNISVLYRDSGRRAGKKNKRGKTVAPPGCNCMGRENRSQQTGDIHFLSAVIAFIRIETACLQRERERRGITVRIQSVSDSSQLWATWKPRPGVAARKSRRRRVFCVMLAEAYSPRPAHWHWLDIRGSVISALKRGLGRHRRRRLLTERRE